jgi:hypothetical protein
MSASETLPTRAALRAPRRAPADHDQGRVLLTCELGNRLRLAPERDAPFHVGPEAVLERQPCQELLRSATLASAKLGLPAWHG